MGLQRVFGHMAGEAEVEGRLVVFRSNFGEVGTYPVPICIVPPSSSLEWVQQKVEDMQTGLGISCVGFEDPFKALLTAIEASHHLQNASLKGTKN